MKGFPTITGGELGVEEERQNNKSRYAVLMLDMNTYAHTKKKNPSRRCASQIGILAANITQPELVPALKGA